MIFILRSNLRDYDIAQYYLRYRPKHAPCFLTCTGQRDCIHLEGLWLFIYSVLESQIQKTV